MNIFERSAMRRAQRQLAATFEPGEKVLEFDIGKNQRGDRVHCVVTNRAVYLVARGEALRLPYSNMSATQGGQSWIGLTTLSGNQYTVDFGRAPRGLSDVIIDCYRSEAEERRQVHVSWGDRAGATFLVLPEGSGENVASWALDEGVEESVTTSMLLEQALGELEVSLGRQPSLQYSDPRPGWMPEFDWEPPLTMPE